MTRHVHYYIKFQLTLMLNN